ncbi:MAG TPA: PEP/pyruvate-binding domain-containing protein, partial [Nocardioides sp.]|nr:PEP/pyruvate-binding domain-containing protein [Nocardioides sp.]
MTELVLPLADCTPDRAGQVGGKAIGLGALLREGHPVPAGFTVTTDAHRAALGDLDAQIAALVPGTEGARADRAASAAIRSLVEEQVVPEAVREAVRAAYLALDPAGEALVAVRSSATAEDLPDASFAGQQDTYLGVRGADAVVAHVLRCWGSLFSPQAIGYRRRFGIAPDDLAMAVVVQTMVEAEAAGVMMTLDPTSGDRSTVFISAAHGLGEGVVKGDVEADSTWVDKASLAVRSSEVLPQSTRHRYDAEAGAVVVETLPADLGRSPAITDAEAVALAAIAVRMEESQGMPQDLEWAIGRGPDGARTLFLLQARPETVWANRGPAAAVPPALHDTSRADSTWTTTNVGESVPGIPTPLGWSMWKIAGEHAMRSAFHAIGALDDAERELPEDPEDWLLAIFHGRASLSVSLVCEWTERVPGTDPAAAAQQIFSATPPGYVSRSQRRYYPRVLAKSGLPLLRVKRMVLDDRRDAEAFRSATLAELATADEARTRHLLEDALAMHRRCLSTQTLLTMAVCQPITDRFLAMAASVGMSGEELMAGYGGHDETAAVADLWSCSRGRLDLDTFLARHGFHAWQEGELSSRSWREDPTPVHLLVESYRGRDDAADPALAEEARMVRRTELEQEFLSRLSLLARPAGRLVLRLMHTFVPLRGIAKGSFVQSLDVVRAAARRLGTLLAERGALADREDVFYLTLPELRGGEVFDGPVPVT